MSTKSLELSYQQNILAILWYTLCLSVVLSLQATRGDNYGNLKFPHKSEKEPLYGNMGIGEPDKPNEVYRLFVCVCVCVTVVPLLSSTGY